MSTTTVAIERITPKVAADILRVQEEKIAKGEFRQRTLKQDSVRKYSAEMKKGHWITNNQGIGFDIHGHLIDGRHRLWGIVKSGMTVDLVVVRNIKSINDEIEIRAVDTIDCGLVRTMSQQLEIDGIKYAAGKAAAMRSIVILCTGHVGGRLPKISTIQTRTLLSIFEPLVDQYYEIFGHKTVLMPRSAFFAALAVYGAGKRRKAEQFVSQYQSLEGLEPGSPVLALFKYYRVKEAYHSQSAQIMAVNATCLALMHFDLNESVNTLRKTEIGVMWLRKEQKGIVKRVQQIVGWEEPLPVED